MINPFRFFATGKNQPLLENTQKVDELYKSELSHFYEYLSRGSQGFY
ncbi:MAG: hypothetical protein JXD22_15475 [Sedimentisphaerales bacterium]|nr:hypothetical protein [Sedimentisphaerales bacterium]